MSESEETDEEFQKYATEKYELLKGFVAQISEHFDAAQVFVSIDRGVEGTFSVQFGAGNLFARQGQVKEWCIKNEERAREEVRPKPDDD